HFCAQKIFPDDNRIFISYTTTLSPDTVDVYLSDYTHKNNIAEAASTIRNNLDTLVGSSKRTMRRIDPTDEELLVLLALSFWNTETHLAHGLNRSDTPSGDDRLSLIASSNRTAIMQEIHAYYSSKGVTDYATRIGDLFCLLVTTEKVSSLIVEDIELLRLMDVNHQPRF
ncbi:hypothetical protein PENTCL1PPCAC_9200, partial [Pristionchus entomophagus]